MLQILYILIFLSLSLNSAHCENLSGKASWYADKFQGLPTASAELYDKNLLTAAHKTLPFGTLVLVKNLANNKEVIVRINDRGPFAPGRDLDLSRAAAAQIDIISSGLAKISYQVLKNK